MNRVFWVILAAILCIGSTAIGQTPEDADLTLVVRKEFNSDSYSRLQSMVSDPTISRREGTIVLNVPTTRALSEAERSEALQMLRGMVRSAFGQASFPNWETMAESLKIEITGPETVSPSEEWVRDSVLDESRNALFADLRPIFDFANSKYEIDRNSGQLKWTVKRFDSKRSESASESERLRALLSTALGQSKAAPAGLNIEEFVRQASIHVESTKISLQFPMDGAFLEYFSTGVHAYFARNYILSNEVFKELVDLGVQDARLMYFLGLSQYQLGSQDEAKSTFSYAAELEFAGKSPQSTGRALERIQGSLRQEIESARLAARLSRFKRVAN